MKLKLSHTEFTALLKMFVAIVLPYEDNSITGIIEKAVLMQIYEKLFKQSVPTKTKYNIKITTAEAASFFQFWQRHQFSNPASYEANLVRITNNLIHQKLIV
jgi:hypothetical protein